MKSNNNNYKVYIAQLQFRLGIMKLFLVVGEFLRAQGLQVKYLLAENYRAHLPAELLKDCLFIKGTSKGGYTFFNGFDQIVDSLRFILFGWFYWIRFFLTSKPDLLFFYFIHPTCPMIMTLSKIFCPRCRTALGLHEPKTRKVDVSRRERLIDYCREAIQALSLLFCHDVVLFSPYGEKLFRENYSFFKGTVHQACLVVPTVKLPETDRDAVNISNRIYTDGRSRLFSDLVSLSAKEMPQLKFRLVTSSTLDQVLRSLQATNSANLEIINSGLLSDEQILQNINRGLVQLFGHNNITQSGVLPLAFMCGTPVLARDLPGFSQFIRHRQNGYLVPPEAPLEAWLEGIRYIKENHQRMSAACRRSYEKWFAPSNLAKYYGWIYQ